MHVDGLVLYFYYLDKIVLTGGLSDMEGWRTAVGSLNNLVDIPQFQRILPIQATLKETERPNEPIHQIML